MQVWTPGSWTGLVMFVMSKMRTPRNRVVGVAAGVDEQSFLPRFSSTDMKSRFPYTERSPCPPGQTTVVTSAGAAGSLTS